MSVAEKPKPEPEPSRAVTVSEKFVNLTPHDIVVCLNDTCGSRAVIPRSGTVARVTVSRRLVGAIDVQGVSIPVVEAVYGGVEGLPAKPEPGKYYIVSLVVADAVMSSPELREKYSGKILVPDTGPGSVVRDEKGRIIGVRYLRVIR